MDTIRLKLIGKVDRIGLAVNVVVELYPTDNVGGLKLETKDLDDSEDPDKVDGLACCDAVNIARLDTIESDNLGESDVYN